MPEVAGQHHQMRSKLSRRAMGDAGSQVDGNQLRQWTFAAEP